MGARIKEESDNPKDDVGTEKHNANENKTLDLLKTLKFNTV